MTPRFDPTRAIAFDLARGQLRDDEGSARLNLPCHLLTRLCEHAGNEATVDFARSLGDDVGRRIAHRLGDERSAANVEAWTEHLGGQVALLGLGDLKVEQWGRALVLRVSGTPEGMTKILEGVLQGALQRGLSRQVSLVGFSHGEDTEFLVLSQATAEKAHGLVAQGLGLGQVVEALHRGNA